MGAPVTPGRTWIPPRSRESGFSMVEMLMAAVIMAIGLLGLCMLQTYALRVQSGSGNRTFALQVAEQVMDEAENQGRMRVLCSQNGITPPAQTINYFGAAIPDQIFTIPVLDTTSLTAGVPSKLGQQKGVGGINFTASTAAIVLTPPVALIGGIAQVNVVVQWNEAVKQGGGTNSRSIALSRQINYD